ncbi:MAG: 5-formyltetrahydrofolate cyclo-ligase [Gammaproteobacteria bacterium]|nr:MAG: 5-formyltetrahydrofolate cyclo-ligase [Gammaproteobacteria bacterium]
MRLFRCARRVAFYIANDGEMDLSALLCRALRYGKRCYLPVLRQNRLAFAPYRSGDRLSPNRFGIPEPVLPKNGWSQAARLDLILIPLVAFDARGNRLGMGAGFYDRTLGFLNLRRYWRRPRLIGVAYDFQRVAEITPAPWDVPLDAVVTEASVYRA